MRIISSICRSYGERIFDNLLRTVLSGPPSIRICCWFLVFIKMQSPCPTSKKDIVGLIDRFSQRKQMPRIQFKARRVANILLSFFSVERFWVECLMIDINRE